MSNSNESKFEYNANSIGRVTNHFQPEVEGWDMFGIILKGFSAIPATLCIGASNLYVTVYLTKPCLSCRLSVLCLNHGIS